MENNNEMLTEQETQNSPAIETQSGSDPVTASERAREKFPSCTRSSK